MKKTMYFVLVSVLTVFLIVLTSCASSTPTTPVETATAIATSTPMLTATPIPTSTPMPANTPCTIIGNPEDIDTVDWTGGYFAASMITVTANVVIKSISVKTAGSGQYFALAIYSNFGGAPDVLIANTTTIADTTVGWRTVPIASVTLDAGQNYWLVSIGKVVGTRSKVEAGAAQKYYNYTWATYLSAGFPLDASGLSWLGGIFRDSKYVSSCN